MAALVIAALEDMAFHFLLRHIPWVWDGRTWSMLQKGREVQSHMDYLLGTYHHIFRNVSNQNPRHNTDHYAVLGCLHGSAQREHQCYLGWSMWIPLCPSRHE